MSDPFRYKIADAQPASDEERRYAMSDISVGSPSDNFGESKRDDYCTGDAARDGYTRLDRATYSYSGHSTRRGMSEKVYPSRRYED